MKIKILRKVQAQRKFAQGVQGLPSTAQQENQVAEHVASKQKTIIHNNLTAKNILDIVSFQGIHDHLRPVVVLERLWSLSDATTSKKGPSPKSVLTSPTGNKKNKAKTSNMCLRSMTPKYLRKPKKSTKGPKVVQAGTSDIDDDCPLQYLKTAPKKTKNVLKSPQKNKGKRTSTEKIVNLVKRRKVTPRNSQKKEKCCQEKINLPPPLRHHATTPSAPERSRRVRISVARRRAVIKNPPATLLSEIVGESHKLPSEISEPSTVRESGQDNTCPPPPPGCEVESYTPPPDYELPCTPLLGFECSACPPSLFEVPPVTGASPAQSDIDIVPPPPCFEVPPIPAQSDVQVKAEDTSISRDNKHVKSATSHAPTNDVAFAVPAQYYGQNMIQSWVETGKSPPHNRLPSPRPPSTRPPSTRSPSTRSPSTRPPATHLPPNRRPSLCPSENYETVTDAARASQAERDKFCSNCTRCKQIDEIIQVTKLLQMGYPLPSEGEDVYQFDPEKEHSCVPANYSGRKRRAHDGPDSHRCLYMDMHIDSPHVVELSSIKVPNQDRSMLSARLVPRSEANPRAADNDQLLGQLLASLKNCDTAAATSIETPGTSNEASKERATEQNTETLENCNIAAATSKETPSTSNETSNKQATERDIGYGGNMVDAPTYHLTEAEFNDPIVFFEKIVPLAAKFGICKVKAPNSFKPKCVLTDDLNFLTVNQYIARMYSRWGPGSREMSSIKAYLATQNVVFSRAPLLDGREVNLPKLYHIVQRHGGLKKVMEKKRWSRVAEEMRAKGPNPEKVLDRLYVKYTLPYDTLPNQERQQLLAVVEKAWNKKNAKLLDWALNPLHRQKKLLGESDSSDDDSSGEDDQQVVAALNEAEDCVVTGRRMQLTTFKKVAATAMDTHFPNSPRPTEEIEQEYWRLVLLATDHVCVNTASIDTGEEGYGFLKSKTDSMGKHPWNLKMLRLNKGNLLRSLGAVLGVTVPTLHLGMVFSTSCWHRDPHGLPWLEYMHSGPPKIWYGVPNEQSSRFRKAVETLCPTSCQNKSIWLPSDITMIPPNLLREHNVSLSRVVQNPGEYIIVLPKAYSCSISTGYTVSESVYFATNSWLKSVHQVFQELRESCEPTMFSLEQLLIALARDSRSSLGVLQQVHTSLSTIVSEELHNRRELVERELRLVPNRSNAQSKKRRWNVREQTECEICRAPLFLSKVTGLTGKKSAVCLQHALRLLDTPKNQGRAKTALELVMFYTETELEDIKTALQKRLFP